MSDSTAEEQAIHHIIEAYVIVPQSQADPQPENQEFASAPHSLEAEIFITDYVQQEGQ